MDYIDNKNFYEILQIKSTATNREIKKAYKRTAIKFHPDKNKSIDSTKIMQKLNEIKETLLNPVKRFYYDRKIKTNKIETNQTDQTDQTDQTNSDDEYFDQDTNTGNNYSNVCKLGDKCFMSNCQRQHPDKHKWIDGAIIKIKNLTEKISCKKISLGNLRKEVERMRSKIDHIYLSGNKLSQEEHNMCNKCDILDKQIKIIKIQIQKMQEFVAKLQNEIM
jgi:DnaJ-class molecular chaperone